LTATDTSTRFSATQSGIQVTAAAAVGFKVMPAAPPVTAGTAASFTITATDPAGNVATGYNGTAQVTSTDPQALQLGTLVSSNGTPTLTAPLNTAGFQSMTVNDSTNNLNSTQTGIQVSPGAATSFTIDGLPASATVGDERTFRLTARDAYGNVATGYTTKL